MDKVNQDIKKLGDSYSLLIISPINNLQYQINSTLKELTKSDILGAYISLNKPYISIKKVLNQEKIETDKIFFIDCISQLSEKCKEKEVLHIRHPSDLTGLSIAVTEFVEKIPNDKYIIIDALSTLLIYNKEELVIAFVKKLVEKTQENNFKMIIFTPETKGGDFVNKISLFFDKVINIE